jgi:hypothetical protein
MRGRASGHDFVDPMIIKILKESRGPMSILSINYMVNGSAGRTINLNVIRDHLTFLVKSRKISGSLNKSTGVTYYRLV